MNGLDISYNPRDIFYAKMHSYLRERGEEEDVFLRNERFFSRMRRLC